MVDSPREGRLARSPDFIQLVDMASESVGGKVSGQGQDRGWGGSGERVRRARAWQKGPLPGKAR